MREVGGATDVVAVSRCGKRETTETSATTRTTVTHQTAGFLEARPRLLLMTDQLKVTRDSNKRQQIPFPPVPLRVVCVTPCFGIILCLSVDLKGATGLPLMVSHAFVQYELGGHLFTTETVEQDTHNPLLEYSFLHHVERVTPEVGVLGSSVYGCLVPLLSPSGIGRAEGLTCSNVPSASVRESRKSSTASTASYFRPISRRGLVVALRRVVVDTNGLTDIMTFVAVAVTGGQERLCVFVPWLC